MEAPRRSLQALVAKMPQYCRCSAGIDGFFHFEPSKKELEQYKRKRLTQGLSSLKPRCRDTADVRRTVLTVFFYFRPPIKKKRSKKTYTKRLQEGPSILWR